MSIDQFALDENRETESSIHRCYGSNDARDVSAAAAATAAPTDWSSWLWSDASPGTSHAGSAGWEATQSSIAATPAAASPAAATSPAAGSTIPAWTQTTI